MTSQNHCDFTSGIGGGEYSTSELNDPFLGVKETLHPKKSRIIVSTEQRCGAGDVRMKTAAFSWLFYQPGKLSSDAGAGTNKGILP